MEEIKEKSAKKPVSMRSRTKKRPSDERNPGAAAHEKTTEPHRMFR